MSPILRLVCAGCASFGLAAHATPSLTFVMDGNTFNQPFRLANTSTANERIVSFRFDLSTIVTNGGAYCFDSVSNTVCNGVVDTAMPFTPVGGSDLLTGLVGPVNVPDGSQLINLAFTGFDTGEALRWLIDVDQVGNVAAQTVDGSELVGANVEVGFSNGWRILGKMALVPNDSNASQFVAMSVVPEPPTIALGLLGAAVLIRTLRRKG
jgi:hypothetical protein